MKPALIFSLVILFFLPTITKAAAYWLEVKGNGKLNNRVKIEVCYGNIDAFNIRHRDTGAELKLTGEFKFVVLNPEGKKTALTLTQQSDCWSAEFTPTQKGTYQILGINDTHPVVDRSKSGGINVKPVDYLSADYSVEESTLRSTPEQLLHIIVEREGKLITVKAFNNGSAAAKGTKLRVFNPENWEKELTLDEKGEAAFKTTMPGLYIIREDWDDNSAGTYKGIAYTSIRHRCNYCLLAD
ncbi:hypothetical protein [Mucilaginibacter agri]|uniref:DUF4198 domain-containing protein n=1 Tax=Mucilaginibacter agri TaxID=2695265 RepID=A0A965ZIS2_9SPHI|nr:hypothetical protein [Mucilaginibacter agri]NCD71850.1 hypothetical protein [Mucilaginibacter agri]